MPRLDTFRVVIKTGEKGVSSPPQYIINGFPLPFDEVAGGVGPGEVFEATGHPSSYPHTLVLEGPDDGDWDIASFNVTYFPMGEEPYTVEFGGVTLQSGSDLNLWHERPAPVFEV